MSSDFRTTSVMILGREYKIRTNESEEFVHSVAAFVDEMMNRIATKMASGTTSQVAVLAALNIAEELFRERRIAHVPLVGASDGASNQVDERLRSLSLRLDEVLESASNSRERAESRPAVPA